MALRYKQGDIAWYHEEGEVIEVEILQAKETQFNPDDKSGRRSYEGEEYTLKATGNVKQRSSNPLCPPILKDRIFTVWRAKNAGGYAGWALLDR